LPISGGSSARHADPRTEAATSREPESRAPPPEPTARLEPGDAFVTSVVALLFSPRTGGHAFGLRIEHSVRGNAITIVERRPPWREELGPEWSSTKVAQPRYDGVNLTLYCSDSSGRWWRYDESAPARDVAPLLTAIDDDVTGIFWG